MTDKIPYPYGAAMDVDLPDDDVVRVVIQQYLDNYNYVSPQDRYKWLYRLMWNTVVGIGDGR